jgi:hypothetical protein
MWNWADLDAQFLFLSKAFLPLLLISSIFLQFGILGLYDLQLLSK